MANLSILVGCFVIIFFFNVVAPASSTTHSVEWSPGMNYSLLETAKTFGVGDTIVFNYDPGHTVDEVSESDYKNCHLENPITSDSNGNTSITLKTTGPHYFICGIPGHCMSGMKLFVTVSSTAKSTPSSLEGEKATPNNGVFSATVMLKPLETLVVTCVVALLYAFTLY